MSEGRNQSNQIRNQSSQKRSGGSRKKRQKKVWRIILILALLGCLICIGILAGKLWNEYRIRKQYEEIGSGMPRTEEETTEPVSTQEESQAEESETEEPLAKIPIDFDELQGINPDIYAWIEIPDTNINYPILQYPGEDQTYYLTHTMNREEYKYGSIYTETINSKDFSDPNTLIYGHNTSDRSMFQNIRYFTDKEYFDERPYIYIYMPGRKLTYEIISCYVYDNRHIMYSFDFSDEEVFAEYLEYIQNPRDMAAQVRDGIELTTEDRIITLSTCVGTGETNRRLLHAVLVKDEKAEYEEPITETE